MMTYDGLETFIIDNQALQKDSGTSRGDECVTDSFDDDAFSSCSSSKVVSESFSSEWLPRKTSYVDWDIKKPGYTLCYSDVEVMKEKFSKLLLGEDVTGGCKSLQTALALSNAITHLANSIFGELWKLEPLSEDKKQRWRMEMDWLRSPTKYMIELVPSKQDGEDGRSLERMIPKARADIHINLPALRKLDTMLIETLDSVVNTEFWYSEVGRKAEGTNKITRECKKGTTRKKLIEKGNVVYQISKAAKSINKSVLLEMPVPTIIKDALPKSGKTSLGDDLYRMLASESSSIDEIFMSLRLVTEHAALEIVNKLEAAIYTWKERISEQANIDKSPVRASWSLVRDSLSEISHIGLLTNRAERLNDQIKSKFSNLPHSYLDAIKIKYGRDIGHAVLEAYSRILANLAFQILSRIVEILQEDDLSNPGEAHVQHEQSPGWYKDLSWQILKPTV